MSASLSEKPDSSTRIRTPRTKQLTLSTRLMSIVAGAGLVALLAVAAWLEPSPNGLGTHQQLGLPPCTFRILFGARCPSCGMTTAWANVMHAQPAAAFRANTGGTLLAIVALAAAPWLLLSAALGRWSPVKPNDTYLVLGAGVFVAITLADWAWRMIAA